VLISLKYGLMHHLSLYFESKVIIFETTAQIPEVEDGSKCGYLRANTYLPANNQHRLLAIIEHAKTNILQQNM